MCRLGRFKMGEDRIHTVEIGYLFKISRFPITNAQYAVFVDNGGYGQAPTGTRQQLPVDGKPG